MFQIKQFLLLSGTTIGEAITKSMELQTMTAMKATVETATATSQTTKLLFVVLLHILPKLT